MLTFQFFSQMVVVVVFFFPAAKMTRTQLVPVTSITTTQPTPGRSSTASTSAITPPITPATGSHINLLQSS